MESVSTWIQAIVAIVQTVAALVLVWVTWQYVQLTSQLSSTSTATWTDAKLPVLVFRFRQDGNHTEERLVNVGAGPAMDIELYSNAEFGTEHNESGLSRTILEKFVKDKPLQRWLLPIDNVIGPDNGDPALQVCYLLSGSTSILKNPDAELEIRYRDVFGRAFKTRFVNLGNNFERGW